MSTYNPREKKSLPFSYFILNLLKITQFFTIDVARAGATMHFLVEYTNGIHKFVPSKDTSDCTGLIIAYLESKIDRFPARAIRGQYMKPTR